ncbi:MAG TPA: TetR/AcrR family transcriptional regulator, partial [Arenimonas sp.]|nr:TetR/AcrR family transcriptional regulator [Arenimonas sp.]
MMQAPRPTSPGRPKDLEKRAAILEAAKALFVEHGYDGTSMDAIAQRAGVSKLTVYSHFQDKDSLFVEAVKAKCEEQLPPDLFSVDLSGPLRAQLLKIARAFFALMTSDEAIGIQRVLARQVGADSKLPRLFWEAGPRRTQLALAEFLRAEVEAGQLEIDDVERAASQFLCLLKGERHA